MSVLKEIVQHSITNNSTSKQMYSFGHDSRFKVPQKCLNDNYYELPSMKDKRSTGFGYGNKLDLAKSTKKTPAPNSYQITSEFDRKDRGQTMGVSRDKMKSSSILGNLPKTPGPGSYSKASTLSDIKYSIRSKVNNGFLSKLSQAPGPGQYEKADTLSENGKYALSRFKTYGIPVVNPERSQSRGTPFVSPGPGAYNPSNKFNSKQKSHNGSMFTQSLRIKTTAKEKQQLANPGPGSYRLKTDFGHYERSIKSVQHTVQ